MIKIDSIIDTRYAHIKVQSIDNNGNAIFAKEDALTSILQWVSDNRILKVQLEFECSHPEITKYLSQSWLINKIYDLTKYCVSTCIKINDPILVPVKLLNVLCEFSFCVYKYTDIQKFQKDYSILKIIPNNQINLLIKKLIEASKFHIILYPEMLPLPEFQKIIETGDQLGITHYNLISNNDMGLSHDLNIDWIGLFKHSSNIYNLTFDRNLFEKIQYNSYQDANTIQLQNGYFLEYFNIVNNYVDVINLIASPNGHNSVYKVYFKLNKKSFYSAISTKLF